MRMWTEEGFLSAGALLLQGWKCQWIRRKVRTARIRSTCALLDFIMVARHLQGQRKFRIMKKAGCGTSDSYESLCRLRVLESCHTTSDAMTTTAKSALGKNINTAGLKVFSNPLFVSKSF